jgi:hypothetical protein
VTGKRLQGTGDKSRSAQAAQRERKIPFLSIERQALFISMIPGERTSQKLPQVRGGPRAVAKEWPDWGFRRPNQSLVPDYLKILTTPLAQ